MRSAAGFIVGAVILALPLPPPVCALRIVSLAPSVTETLFALGAGAEVVGVSAHCDYPPQVTEIDRVGTFLTPNVEKILVKRPDLVIGVPTPGNRSGVQALEGLGLRVLVVDPQTIEQIEAAILRIAAAVNRAGAGEALVQRMRVRVAAVQARLAGVPSVRVLMVVGHDPLIAAGGGVLQDELIRLAHGTNVAAGAGGRWPHLSLEWVLQQAPEVIIDSSMGAEAGAGERFWRVFASLPAVRDGRVHDYRDAALLRPGPRVAGALETVARLVHPQRFAGEERR